MTGGAGLEGRHALLLAATGLGLAALCVLLEAASGLSVGPLHVFAALALAGLLAVVAGGVLAAIAIVARRERSPWLFGLLPVALLALLVVVSEFALDIP